MSEVRPDRIIELAWAHIPQRALTTAVDLALFTHLANGARTAAEAAGAAGASERGVRMVLDSVTALGLLTKQDGVYSLTPEAETFLVQGKDTYLGTVAQHFGELWGNFGHLTEVVRTGQSRIALEDQVQGPAFFEQMVAQIFSLTYPQARAAAEGLGVGDRWAGLTVLDVGAGAGPFAIAMLQRDPTARATAVDWPAVLEITRRFAERFGVADRLGYTPGDLREVDFGEARCDLAVLGHICHGEGSESSRKLFRRLHRALRPGGKLLIADMIPDEERRSAVFPLLFALNMLVHSTSGDTFTLGEYTRWLHDAGFGAVSTLEAPGGSPLIVADR